MSPALLLRRIFLLGGRVWGDCRVLLSDQLGAFCVSALCPHFLSHCPAAPSPYLLNVLVHKISDFAKLRKLGKRKDSYSIKPADRLSCTAMRRRPFRRAVRSSDFTARNAGWNSTVTGLLGVAAGVARVAGGLRARRCVCVCVGRSYGEAQKLPPLHRSSLLSRGAAFLAPRWPRDSSDHSCLHCLSVPSAAPQRPAGPQHGPCLRSQPVPSGWTLP